MGQEVFDIEDCVQEKNKQKGDINMLRKTKRTLSLVLALIMICSAMGIMAFAAEPCEYCDGGTVYGEDRISVKEADLPSDFRIPASYSCNICDQACDSIWTMRYYICCDCDEVAYISIAVDYDCHRHGIVEEDSWVYIP